jgi:hypothetical protein
MDTLTTWAVLVLTFTTENATARMRAWRALKAKGCAVLRDGIYLLPHTGEREDMLRELADSIDEAGGTAHLLRAQSLDASQEADFRALFDRNADCATFVASLSAARKTLGGLPPADVTRLLRRLRKDYDAIRTIDYFPGNASTDVDAAWEDFTALADTVLSPGEPRSAERVIRPLRRDDYQARTWATRQRLWVDRVASAWLILRFIDPQARFVWLASPAACPPDALGFDFDGAAFTHVGERVTFEVLIASFGLDEDAALLRLVDAVAVAMITPGPVVITVGFIGYLVAGFSGACVAALGTFLPCYLFTVPPAPYFKKYGKLPAVKAFVDGITAAAVGAIAGSVIVIARRSIVDWPNVLLVLVTVVLLWRFKKLQEPVIVVAAALFGLVVYPLIHSHAL